MLQDLLGQAFDQFKVAKFDAALDLLELAIRNDSTDWNTWYFAGQCYRFLGDIDTAIRYLLRARALKDDEATVHLALGIAYQLQSQWDEAIKALRKAVHIDADHELAYNSLALTYKKIGRFSEALFFYDAGAKALARRLAKAMVNRRDNPIAGFRQVSGSLWLEYALGAGLYVAAEIEEIKSISLPTGEEAEEEARTGEHGGLYWIDSIAADGSAHRHFLPNFLDTFRELFRCTRGYSTLIGNRGTVFKELGQNDEAQRHFAEATEFLPST